MGTLLLAVLVVAVVVLVALPLVRVPAARDRLDTLADPARRRLALREERDAALAALKELDFDRRTGKVSELDAAPLEAELRARAAAAMAALEEPAPTPSEAPGTIAPRA
jgi:hypothetical protein